MKFADYIAVGSIILISSSFSCIYGYRKGANRVMKSWGDWIEEGR